MSRAVRILPGLILSASILQASPAPATEISRNYLAAPTMLNKTVKMKNLATVIAHSLARHRHLSGDDLLLLEAMHSDRASEDILLGLRQDDLNAVALFSHIIHPPVEDLMQVRDILSEINADADDWQLIQDLVEKETQPAMIHVPGITNAITVKLHPVHVRAYVQEIRRVLTQNPTLKNMIDRRLARVLPFTGIVVSHMQLRSKELFDHWVLTQPNKHLRECNTGFPVGKFFSALLPQTEGLLYNVTQVRDKQGNVCSVLTVSEIGQDENVLRSWTLLDQDGGLIEVKHSKRSTLAFPFVSDDKTYEEKARFTYTFAESWERHLPPEELIVRSTGFEWIEIPSLQELAAHKSPPIGEAAELQSHMRWMLDRSVPPSALEMWELAQMLGRHQREDQFDWRVVYDRNLRGFYLLSPRSAGSFLYEVFLTDRPSDASGKLSDGLNLLRSHALGALTVSVYVPGADMDQRLREGITRGSVLAGEKGKLLLEDSLEWVVEYDPTLSRDQIIEHLRQEENRFVEHLREQVLPRLLSQVDASFKPWVKHMIDKGIHEFLRHAHHNAVDAVMMKPGSNSGHAGRIAARILLYEYGVEIQMQDNGVGLPFQGRSFWAHDVYRFVKRHSTSKDPEKPLLGGRGRGLIETYSWVKGQRGALGVWETPGGGTTFSAVLPWNERAVPRLTRLVSPKKPDDIPSVGIESFSL